MKPGRTIVGISGWNYPPWRGVFYPPGLRHADELAYAGASFDGIEINGSFYSLKRPETYSAWHDATPKGLVFAVKGSRYVTHMLKLRNCETALANFFASGVLALAEKLGPILWQLPPQLHFDAERLEAFFQLLPKSVPEAEALAARHDARLDGRSLIRAPAGAPRTSKRGGLRASVRARRIRHTIEVRHESYRCPEFIRLLRKHRVACCVADTAGVHPQLEDVTADFVYVRLHGGQELYVSGYDEPAISYWAERIRAWQTGSQPEDAALADPRGAARNTASRSTGAPSRSVTARTGRDVYVFFDNDVKVRAPFDALALRAALAGLERRAKTPEESARLSRVTEEARTVWPTWRSG